MNSKICAARHRQWQGTVAIAIFLVIEATFLPGFDHCSSEIELLPWQVAHLFQVQVQGGDKAKAKSFCKYFMIMEFQAYFMN